MEVTMFHNNTSAAFARKISPLFITANDRLAACAVRGGGTG